jgi:hypothetical protein
MKACGIVLAVVLSGLLALGVLWPAGCVNPPAHTLYIDQNGDGRIDSLAWDRDGDGKPDADANGSTLIVPGSEGYRNAEIIDSAAPSALGVVGSLLGATGAGAVLAGIAAAWRMGRFGRIFMNTVMCVQAARLKLKETGNAESLTILDDALSKQLPATIARVQEVKDRCFAPSVNTEPAPQPQ